MHTVFFDFQGKTYTAEYFPSNTEHHHLYGVLIEDAELLKIIPKVIVFLAPIEIGQPVIQFPLIANGENPFRETPLHAIAEAIARKEFKN